MRETSSEETSICEIPGSGYISYTRTHAIHSSVMTSYRSLESGQPYIVSEPFLINNNIKYLISKLFQRVDSKFYHCKKFFWKILLLHDSVNSSEYLCPNSIFELEFNIIIINI